MLQHIKNVRSLVICSLALSACSNDDSPVSNIKFENHSVTPSFVKKQPGFESVEVYSFISSDDALSESPNFIFGGYADGAGIIKNPNSDGYFMLVNHEDNFAVSRITLDKTFKPVKGEYILNSDAGQWRLCSATLATPEEHGFGPLFLTSGESGPESRTHALEPFSSPNDAGVSREVAAFGRWNAENAVPLPKGAYPGKTVIIIGDDDSGTNGGQIALYVSNTPGDLASGELYMMRRVDQNQAEMNMRVAQSYPVEFVKIATSKPIQEMTGAEINASVNTLKGLVFGRVEDLDYRKGGGNDSREIYFNVTGQNNTGVNADYSRSKFGRVYKLVLDSNDPLKGTISVELDGDDANGPANEFQNVDNIYVGNDYFYTSEDPGDNGNLAGVVRDAILWQYNLSTKELKKVFEVDQRRGEEKYNKDRTLNPVTSAAGEWEFGAMIDLSDVIGEAAFAICIQAHSWRDAKYVNPDGGGTSPRDADRKEGSQIIIVKGLPK